jgi:hypothetical protein
MEHSILGREEEKGLISKQRLAEDEMTSLNHQAKSTKSYDTMTLLPPSRVTTAK